MQVGLDGLPSPLGMGTAEAIPRPSRTGEPVTRERPSSETSSGEPGPVPSAFARDQVSTRLRPTRPAFPPGWNVANLAGPRSGGACFVPRWNLRCLRCDPSPRWGAPSVPDGVSALPLPFHATEG
jgi:hypothetical protein